MAGYDENPHRCIPPGTRAEGAAGVNATVATASGDVRGMEDDGVQALAVVHRPGDGEDVPAVAWLPGRPAAQRPLVLLGHGGGLHKEAPYIARLGNWMASGGYAALAIDLPYHGDRTPAEEQGLSAVERRSQVGLRAWWERNSQATGQAIADWKAAIAAVQHLDSATHAPFGYLGFSMSTRFGIPLAAAEPRITAAVFGLFGHPATDPGSPFARAARQVTAAVLYLLQWDDELFPREDGLALFDLLATRDKTMHVNPGGHVQIPGAEVENAAQFLRRRLGGDSDLAAAPDRPATQGIRE
jgi:dienelactone hydrolase